MKLTNLRQIHAQTVFDKNFNIYDPTQREETFKRSTFGRFASGIADADTIRYEAENLGFDLESRKKAVNQMIYAVRNMIEFQKAAHLFEHLVHP
jgi:hypothetical protein